MIDHELEEMHWRMSILGAIDVGIVVLDNADRIVIWNEFMENHSGIRPSQVRDRNLFQCFQEIDSDWLSRKLQRVRELGSRVFITWEQRAYVFRFHHHRPVTGRSEWMYQNLTLLPLKNPRGEISHVCLIVYDVSEQATLQLALEQIED
ncbi:hypothetical protein CWI84_06790 [Idiomarina tyrosinivorans]|uniref:PAS domain-containing protein n=1 Tax=Idiomarina tyrosinivorans TaxID=1445662 RepID=A0A432ZR53_9GAMM|nr:PAS domain-containing protein [Idiomarina tyrosinivorans]RUO80332.1 hypothetical protein CWI84_06790 [Idiomarina tyrosinivorans]